MGKADRGERQCLARVVPHKRLHRPSPSNETRNLKEPHPGDSHGNDRGRVVVFLGQGRRVIELGEVAPATQQRQSYVPTIG